jgi:hypothetical protein
VTFCWWVYIEDWGSDGEVTIAGTYTAPTTQHVGLLLDRSASGATWRLRMILKNNSLGYFHTFPSSPVGKWYLITTTAYTALAATLCRAVTTIHDPALGTTTVVDHGYNATTGTAPDNAVIGNGGIFLAGGQRNFTGIVLFSAIKGYFLAGGATYDSVPSINIVPALVTGKGLSGPITFGTETQTLTTSGSPTGGTIRLTFEGQQTGTINHNANAATIKSALEALSNIGVDDIVVTGGPLNTTPVVIEFVGALCQGANRTLITLTSNALTGGSSPTVAISRSREFGTFSACRYATNYAAGALANFTSDARTGKSLVGGGDPTGNLSTFDVGSASFPNYHQLPRGSTVTGAILSVNPYTYGSMAYPVPTDITVGSESSPATALTLAASGRRGPNLTKLANWINNGTGSGQLRVGIHGNSRAQIASQYPLRLSDGTYPGRTLMNNFNDMGLIGQAGLWNNGRIVGKFSPIPTCQWTGTNALEGEYGCDCSAALPRCTNAVPTVVNPSAVLTSLVNSTLGSRFTPASRTATSVPSSAGDANNYRGNGSAVRLSPGCTYRIMIREENGLPVTDPLTVKLHILNYPASSTISAAKKVIGAGQLNTEDTSSVLSPPVLGGTPPTAKAITAVSAASLTSQVAHTSYGSVTVNDVDNGFSTLEAGDLMQLADSGGVTNVYNEAWIVRSVTNKGQVNCTITYEWLPRQAPIIGDKVTYIKASEILQTVTATFIAGEAGATKWRGIEITASAGGDGVILWGLEFVNPSRDGIIPVTLGRNGCGAWIQAARWPRVEDSTGVSLSERLFQTLDLDVAVLATADQGTAGNNYVTSYDTIIDYFQADTPSTELVLYGTGPEWSVSGENSLNKADDGNKYDWAAVLQYAARSAGLPNTAYLFSRYTSAFGRMMAGDDTTESPTHPSCVLDVSFLGQQLGGLSPINTISRIDRTGRIFRTRR